MSRVAVAITVTSVALTLAAIPNAMASPSELARGVASVLAQELTPDPNAPGPPGTEEAEEAEDTEDAEGTSTSTYVVVGAAAAVVVVLLLLVTRRRRRNRSRAAPGAEGHEHLRGW